MLKRVLNFVIFVLSVFLALSAHAETFDIENYEVFLKVNRDRLVEVQEAIWADFSQPAHGIFRDIDLKDSKITDVHVDNTFTAEAYNSYLRVKIGSAQQLVSGRQRYIISYKHQLYGRRDEFYYNIIGTRWPVNIKKVRFYVEMPAPFDASKVGISIGKYGTVGFKDGALFTVSDHIISGETTAVLLPYQGITLRLEVPQNYFSVNDNPIAVWVLLAIVMLTMMSFAVWFLYGKDSHIVPVVTFKPPKEIYVREAELICTEKVTTKSLVALLIALAQQGYLKIINQRYKGFTLEKVKDYDGGDAAAQKFMDALFPEYATYGITSITQSGLEKSPRFYKECTRIVSSLNGSKTRFFSAISVNFKMRCLMFLFILGVLALTMFAFCHYYIGVHNMGEYFGNIMMMAGVLIMLRQLGISCVNFMVKCLVPIAFMLVTLYAAMIEMVHQIDQSNLMQVIFGVFGLAVTTVCYIQLPQLNHLGRQMKGRLMGLKKFIQVAEKKRLETMVEENPEYFYEVLPYAYILGVSDKWISRFENIMTAQPEWYTGTALTADAFDSFASSLLSATKPSVNNGGVRYSSGGGGGFSGGGHGGGGGGSW
ncbi:MAG: DUF2207 domain-containing protein [Alphaproteobacteria bacterium]|nr:DUF2207 domain-containing protein [Alphaproteobacteria bacterium]